MATNNAVNVSLSGQSGTGSFAGTTSPSFTTPVLGTPTSGTLTNCTGLPVSTGISGLGTGVATWLASPTSANLASAVATTSTGSGSLVFATSPTFVTPLLDTPTSGTLTNCTGLPVGAITGLGSGVATWLATPTSANLLSAVATTNTGTGALVFATSPALVTPALGTPASGVLTNCTGLPVGGGGTGNTTFTAYSVLCAGTTSGGAFQNVSGLGSTGNVLTSNGAGALPSWSAAGASTGRLLSIQVLTSGTGATYTRNASASSIMVEAVGGGGAGGGVGGSASNYGAGGGGGAGGYARKWITSAASTYLYTIGAGGTGVSGNNPGNVGGNTTFGSTIITATGGNGGGGFAPVNSSNSQLYGTAASGGTPTGGDINVIGGYGTYGMAIQYILGGSGGSSIFGPGSITNVNSTASTSAVGVNATANSGGGGSGATCFGANTARAGGNGGSGIIYVYEYS